MPPSHCRKKKSGVIEHSPALRLHRRVDFPSERAADFDTKGGESLLCRGSSSFLPSFLSLPNDVFPAIGFPCEQWLRGRTGREGEGGKHEEKGADSVHPLLIHRLFLRFTVCTRKTMGRGKKGRKTEERRKNLSKSEKGGNRAGSIGGNPSGRVSRFAEHEILPVSSLHRPARRVALSLSPPAPLTRASGERVSALNDMHVHVLASASSSSALIAPYPPPRTERGIRALIRANYTGGSQFNFTYRPSQLYDPQLDVSIIDLL